MGRRYRPIENMEKRHNSIDTVPVVDLHKKETEAKAYYNSGFDYYKQKQYEQAIADYSKAIELALLAPGYYNNRGIAYRHLGQYEQAIQDFDEVIQYFPSWGYNNRGNVYCALGQYERAIQDFDKAIQTHSSFALAYYNRGNTYYMLRNFSKAAESYVKAGTPNDVNVNNNLKACLAAKTLTRQWFICNDKATQFNLNYDTIQINPNYDILKDDNDLIHLDALNLYEQVTQNIDDKIKLNPYLSELYNSRGSTYSDYRQYKQAIEDYDKAIKLNPNYFNAYANRGEAYENLGQYDKALADYDKALEFAPNDELVKEYRQRLLNKMQK